MGKVVVKAFSLSLDGYGAGPHQTLTEPMGTGSEGLHTWMRTTKMFHQMTGKDGGAEGTDNDIAINSMKNNGAWIMGRNMFGPIRGPWPDNEWKGWWGPEPPYHCDVFVLTHKGREGLEMKGGTKFYFITDGIVSALEKAKLAANGQNIRIGGGVSTVRQYLQAGLIDELHLTISPVLLGSGEHLFAGLDLLALGFSEVEKINGEKAMHVLLRRK